MSKSKPANAIVHAVYMGHGIRVYYEKTNITTYKGKEASVVADLAAIVWISCRTGLLKKWDTLLDAILQRNPRWPRHHILCYELNDCRKCKPKQSFWAKALR